MSLIAVLHAGPWNKCRREMETLQRKRRVFKQLGHNFNYHFFFIQFPNLSFHFLIITPASHASSPPHTPCKACHCALARLQTAGPPHK